MLRCSAHAEGEVQIAKPNSQTSKPHKYAPWRVLVLASYFVMGLRDFIPPASTRILKSIAERLIDKCATVAVIQNIIPESTTNATPGLPEYRHRFNKLKNQRKQGCKPLSGEFDGQLMEQRSTYRALFVALEIR